VKVPGHRPPFRFGRNWGSVGVLNQYTAWSGEKFKVGGGRECRNHGLVVAFSYVPSAGGQLG
jgi:hypothetical protein